jgi:hypothetical protein
MARGGRKEVEEVQDVNEVEDRKPDRAAVGFCGGWLTITSPSPRVFL